MNNSWILFLREETIRVLFSCRLWKNSVLILNDQISRFSPWWSVPTLDFQIFQQCCHHHHNYVHPPCCWSSFFLPSFPQLKPSPESYVSKIRVFDPAHVCLKYLIQWSICFLGFFFCCPRYSQESSPTKFKRVNILSIWLLQNCLHYFEYYRDGYIMASEYLFKGQLGCPTMSYLHHISWLLVPLLWLILKGRPLLYFHCQFKAELLGFLINLPKQCFLVTFLTSLSWQQLFVFWYGNKL